MAAIKVPIVSNFCGCIDLKVACVVIAAMRLIASIFLFIILLLLFFEIIEIEEKLDEMGLEDKSSKLMDLLASFLLVIVIIMCLTNMVCSYWFIRSVTSNNPTRMKYYLILNVIDIIFYCLFGIFKLNISYLLAAAIDVYLFICAYSIYQMNMSHLQEDSNNLNETTIAGNAHEQPPSYGSGYEMEGGKVVTFQKEEP